jgi:hypothetical protein
MTSGQRPASFIPTVPRGGDISGAIGAHSIDGFVDAGRPLALRCLLLFSGAVTATDPALLRLSDHDLVMLRASLDMLASVEPTSAA